MNFPLACLLPIIFIISADAEHVKYEREYQNCENQKTGYCGPTCSCTRQENRCGCTYFGIKEKNILKCYKSSPLVSNANVTHCHRIGKANDPILKCQVFCQDDRMMYGSAIVFCNNGVWNPDPPKCLEPLCKLIIDKKIQNTKTQKCTMNPYKRNEVICELVCKDGFRYKGPNTPGYMKSFKCTSYKEHDSQPVCEKIPTTPIPPVTTKKPCPGQCKDLVIAGAIASCPKIIPNEPYKCEYTCDTAKGFKRQSGSNKTYCSCKREWSDGRIVCKKPSKDVGKPCEYKSPSEKIGDDEVYYCQKNKEGWQTACALSCRFLYEIRDQETKKPYTCDFKTGKWINNFNCTLKDPYDCLEIYESEGRLFTCEAKNTTAPWKCGISCATGYDESEDAMKQSRIVKCKHGKEWDWTNTLTCQERSGFDYKCPIERVKGTTYECNTTASYDTSFKKYYGQRELTITCKTLCMEGYYLRENNDPRVCQMNGKWTKPLLQCYDSVPCKKPFNKYATKPSDIASLFVCTPPEGPPTKCSFVCPIGTSAKGDIPLEASCLINGTWDNWTKDIPKCTETSEHSVEETDD